MKVVIADDDDEEVTVDSLFLLQLIEIMGSSSKYSKTVDVGEHATARNCHGSAFEEKTKPDHHNSILCEMGHPIWASQPTCFR